MRHAHVYNSSSITPDPDLLKVFDAIRANTFGDAAAFSALIAAIIEHGDYYLVSDDFHSYITTQDLVDAAYRDQDGWVEKCIQSVARMGFFSTDRVIYEYAESIWNVEPVDVAE